MQDTWLRTKTTITRYRWLVWPIIPVLVVIGYIWCRPLLISQDTQYYANISPITLNFALFLFMYGVVTDRATKKMKRWKSWLLWGIGLILILLFFRFVGGYETIFG